jgi:hypothetical protein
VISRSVGAAYAEKAELIRKMTADTPKGIEIFLFIMIPPAEDRTVL